MPSSNGASRTASPIPPVIGGRCPSSRKHGMAGSMTSMDFTSNLNTRSTPSIPHTAAPSKKVPSAAVPEWYATNSRAASARLREKSNRKSAPIQSVSWCNATMARAKISASRGSLSARRFPTSVPTPPLHSAIWTVARSSLSSPPTRRSLRINSSASPAAFLSGAAAADHVVDLKIFPNDLLDPVFAATVQATEEAVINAMVAAETMTGIENHKVIALPHDRLREVLKKYNRLAQGGSTPVRNGIAIELQ